MNRCFVNSRLAYENLAHAAHLAQLNRDGDCARAQQAWLSAWLRLSIRTLFERSRAVPAAASSSVSSPVSLQVCCQS